MTSKRTIFDHPAVKRLAYAALQLILSNPFDHVFSLDHPWLETR